MYFSVRFYGSEAFASSSGAVVVQPSDIYWVLLQEEEGHGGVHIDIVVVASGCQ